jgi:tetratricopeptide (TPR) repeat protein
MMRLIAIVALSGLLFCPHVVAAGERPQRLAVTQAGQQPISLSQYRDILDEYESGSPDRAIDSVVRWWHSIDRSLQRLFEELRLRPQVPTSEPLLRRLRLAAAIHSDAGVALAKQARLTEAIEQLNVARAIARVELFQEAVGNRHADLPRLVRLAEVWVLQGGLQLDLVEKPLAELTERYPRDPDVLRTCGADAEAQLLSIVRGPLREAYWEARPSVEWARASKPRELERAVSCYERARAIDATDAETLVRLGRVRYLQGAWSDARAALLASLQYPAPAHVRYWAHLFLGGVETAAGQPGEAALAYRRAAQLAPRAQSPVLGLSAASARAGDWLEARQFLDTALEGGREGAADPWWLYPFGQSHRLDDLIVRLRELIRDGGGGA